MSEQLSSIPIQFTARGDVPRGAGAYALRRIEHVLGKVPGPVLHAHVTLALGTTRRRNGRPGSRSAST
jgi:hypothetical protein